MNFKKIEKTLDKYFKKNLGLNFEFEYKDDKLKVKNNITFNDLNTTAYCSLTFRKTWASCAIYFDNIDETPEVLELINNFNKNALFFHLYADEFLIAEHTVALLNDFDIVEYVDELFSDLASDNFTDFIKPLIELTYEEEE